MSVPASRGPGAPPKPSPRDVVAESRQRLQSRSQSWEAVDSVLRLSSASPNDLRVTAAEEALHTFAVTVEDCLSRWFIHSVRQNGRPALTALRGQVELKLQREAEKLLRDARLEGPHYRPVVTLVLGGPGTTAVRAPDVQRFFDAGGRNVTFHEKATWNSQAGLYLAAPYKTAAHSVTEDDWLLIRFVRALRNYVAHRSDSSRQEANATTTSLRTSSMAHKDLVWDGRRSLRDQAGCRAGDLLLKDVGGTPCIMRVAARLDTVLEKLEV